MHIVFITKNENNKGILVFQVLVCLYHVKHNVSYCSMTVRICLWKRFIAKNHLRYLNLDLQVKFQSPSCSTHVCFMPKVIVDLSLIKLIFKDITIITNCETITKKKWMANVVSFWERENTVVSGFNKTGILSILLVWD